MGQLIHCPDGDFEFYIVEYHHYIPPRPNVLIRCPHGQSPASRIHQLTKEGKIREGWARVREATVVEIEWWKERHK